MLNCAKEIKEDKKDNPFINCTNSSTVTSENYGNLIIKVESKDKSFLLQNVSLSFTEHLPEVNKDSFLHSLHPIPFVYSVNEVTIPKVVSKSFCRSNLNLDKDTKYNIQLPAGEYYASLSNEQERYFSFEPEEDKLILFMFGYFFDKKKEMNINFNRACENKFEDYDWTDDSNGETGAFVRNFNACPKIKINKERDVVITIIPSEKIRTSFWEFSFKIFPGILVLGIPTFTNRPLAYYNQRKYEIIME